MKKAFLIILLVSLVFAAGCTEEKEEPITKLIIGNQAYKFSNDVKKTLETVHLENLQKVLEIANSSRIDLVYNESGDANYSTVVVYNIVYKLTRYRAWELRRVNITTIPVTNASFSGPTILLKGPNTGAEKTSVSAINQTIIVQGTSYKNYTMAADRLSLAIMGVFDSKQLGLYE